MAKFARRRIIFYFFSIVLFIAAMFPVYAGGRQEPELTRADDLIKELRHDEAILLLTDFARRNPRMFDQAQQRLRKIYQTRDEFNRTADTLIDTLIRDPENNERVLALSRHLYTLEHESSPLMINFVARTREIAQFNINRILLRRIMERGRDLLDRGESLAALQTYAEGMSFMREEFFLAGFGQTIEIEVNRETERINAMLASFQQVSTQMGAVSAELLRAINAGETARVPEITSRLNTAMDRFIALKHTVYTSLNSFERTLNAIRAVNPDTGDRNHLSFLSAVIRGRQNESISEGMLGAFDNYWNNSIGSILTGITQNLERSNTTAISALQARNFTAVSSALSNTDYLVNLTPFYFDKHRQLYETGRQPATALYGATILNIDIPRFIEIRALREANGYLVNAAGIASRAAGDGGSFASYQQGTMSAAQALVLEQQTRANIVTMQRSIVELVARADQFHTEINRFHNTMHVFNTARAIENLNRIYTAEGQQSAARFFSISQENLNASIAQRKVQLEKARELLNGESAVAADGTAVVYRYPTEAFAELTALNTAMTNDLQASNAVMEQFRIEQAAGNTDPQIAALRASYQASLNELNSVRDQSTPLTETARTRSSQAEAHRLEGERLFREAQAAFQRRNFDLAIERLNDATGRLDDSLAIQESPPLRQTRDNQIMSLSGAIAEAMNDSVIEEVRTLLGSAQTSYYNGNFQQAESNLVTASNRWRLINSEPHEEVVYWLGIVRIALSATSGRVIPPTAPLYPEMSQLLNQAQRNYEEGVRLINAGQRTQGTARFEEAQKLTREVRLMFPVNQEAGILELRIEQFLNPSEFNADFERRLRTAQNSIRANRDMTSFADLLNLAEINPRYPNMRAIITQAEIDMRIRPPPPNPSDVAESRELTASASRIINANNTAQYETARIQLDRALRLNPENAEASRLRDVIQRRLHAPQDVVLSSQDEADYQRALRAFNAGNNLEAYTIVQRLMQNPRNRNIQKLVALQQRINI